MARRKFIKQTIALIGLGSVALCNRKRIIKGSVAGASAHIGHLLRDKTFNEPSSIEQKEVVIVGGGISGLSAAYHLNRLNINDIIVLELEDKVGGNAANGKNEISAFPMGAHYIPIPNNSLTQYIKFLRECDVIIGFDEAGLPIYNDYHLCFDPEERLYINGLWQEGLIPNHGLSESDRKQIQSFLELMNIYRYHKGKDGKDRFAIPVDESSIDEEFITLDSLNFREWMLENGFTSQYLHWYVNYCTRDDYGTNYNETSAWAGIYYFACRKGRGANAEYNNVLTWPEGNGWLVEKLKNTLTEKLHTQALVVSIQQNANKVWVDYFDVKRNQLKRIECKQCVIAVPQFVAARLLKDDDRILKVKSHLSYAPWMVANLKVSNLTERSGAPASWDNVVYGSYSLGYVDATHQQLQQFKSRRNLTYYLPLTASTAVEERKKALKKTHAEWANEIIADLKKIHPNIEEAIEEININIWGHAMAKPVSGFIHGLTRKQLGSSIDDKIHFAHTDLAGNSIFEEAFYQGLNAAEKVKAEIS